MDNTFVASLDDRGRFVVPAELRKRLRWKPGSSLLFIETPGGVLLATREQATTRIREQLAGTSPVDELSMERRTVARDEDDR